MKLFLTGSDFFGEIFSKNYCLFSKADGKDKGLLFLSKINLKVSLLK